MRLCGINRNMKNNTSLTQKTTHSKATFTLGILSIVLGIIPFVGLALAVAGTALGIRGVRKYEKTPEGNLIVVHVPWARVDTQHRVGLILSVIGIFLGAFVTVFGAYFVYMAVQVLISGVEL